VKQIKKSIHIAAPAARIYEFVTQPMNMLEIMPSLVEVMNVTRAPDGTHAFDYVYKMAGIHFRGHAETLKIVQNRRSEVQTKGGIPSTFRWTFDGRNDSTEVRLEIEYEVPVPLLQKLAEAFLVKINEREAETLLANLKERLEIAKPLRPEAAEEEEKRV